MDIPESFRDIPLSSQQASTISMDIPRNIPENIPPLKKTLNLESLQKKVEFDEANDIDLSRGGVYDPDDVDDLISWLEGNRRQEVVFHWLNRLAILTLVNISLPS